VALRASSSDWPSSSAETSMGAAGGGPDPDGNVIALAEPPDS
jgi:hypothetical protein